MCVQVLRCCANNKSWYIYAKHTQTREMRKVGTNNRFACEKRVPTIILLYEYRERERETYNNY